MGQKRVKIESFLRTVLQMQFEVIGLDSDWDFVKEFTSREDWYLKHTWTKEQEEKYKKWFCDEAKKRFRWSNRIIEREWAYWNLSCGWRRKDVNS